MFPVIKRKHLSALRKAFPDVIFTDYSADICNLRPSLLRELEEKLERTGKLEVLYLTVQRNPVFPIVEDTTPDGRRYLLGSEQWHTVLAENAYDVARLLTPNGAIVLWGRLEQDKLIMESDIVTAFRNVYYRGAEIPKECGICYETDFHRYHTCPGCSKSFCINCILEIEGHYVISKLKDGHYGGYVYYDSQGAELWTHGLANDPNALKCPYCRTHTLPAVLSKCMIVYLSYLITLDARAHPLASHATRILHDNANGRTSGCIELGRLENLHPKFDINIEILAAEDEAWHTSYKFNLTSV